MCMRFGCNPHIIFVTFFTDLTYSFFGWTSTKAYRHSSNRAIATPPTILFRSFLKLCGCFVSWFEDKHEIKL